MQTRSKKLLPGYPPIFKKKRALSLQVPRKTIKIFNSLLPVLLLRRNKVVLFKPSQRISALLFKTSSFLFPSYSRFIMTGRVVSDAELSDDAFYEFSGSDAASDYENYSQKKNKTSSILKSTKKVKIISVIFFY